MIEVPIGAVAWLGVVMFQALFFGILSPRRRKSHAELEFTSREEKWLDAIEEEASDEGGSRLHQEDAGYDTPLSISPCFPAFGDSSRHLEEEPRDIRQLLNQTGSELVIGSPQECHSMSFFERLAKEQLQSQESDDASEEALCEDLNLQRRLVSTE